MNDLFGNPVEKEKPKNMVKGYMGTPGRGPVGHHCRDCLHAYARFHTKTYWKCDLVKPTCGPGTDIRLKSPACQFWEKQERKEK